MATPSGAFEFVNGPARHHTKRIKPEEWDKWRPIITSLFSKYQLKEVIARMQLEHGFCANERQYTHHLRKWGVKKQGLGTTVVGASSLSHHLETPDFAASGTRKRPRPSASIHSVSSAGSSLSGSKPPRKRVEQDATSTRNRKLETSREASKHDTVTETALTSSPTTNTAHEADIESRLPPPNTSRAASHDSLSVLIKVDTVSCSPLQAGESTLPDNSGDITGMIPFEPPFTSSGASNPVSISMSNSSPTTAKSNPTLRALRAIDIDCPVETFSDQDIIDMECAAECLSMVSCDREAFQLYTTILKRYISDNARRDNRFWYLIIQCAQTASIPDHAEVIQSFIRAELARVQTFPIHKPCSCTTTGIRLLLHMLLAVTSRWSQGNVEDEIDNACASLEAIGLCLIFSHLSLHPSTVLPFYRNMLRLLRMQRLPGNSSWGIPMTSSDLWSPIPFEFRPYGARLENLMPLESPTLEVWPLEIGILYRTPGPFEIQQDGLMANPCIRSCILWCRETIQDIQSIPHSREILEIYMDEDARGWASANSLFVWLWKCWKTCTGPTNVWMSKTMERMGISSTELLLLVCRAIYKSRTPEDLFNDVWEPDYCRFIHRMRARCQYFAHQQDIHVARAILGEYVSSHTLTQWPSWRSMVLRFERDRAMETFENVLRVRFPKLDVPGNRLRPVLISRKGNSHLVTLLEEDDKDEERDARGSHPGFKKAQVFSPTLASSLSSLDLSSFKKTSASAQVRFSKFLSEPSSTSSSLRHRQNRSRTSFAGESSTSDLGRSFQSLSVSCDSSSRMESIIAA
ncbi:hypothetical protein V8F20_003473 [Naviculisporaceae sp. PSN 640]